MSSFPTQTRGVVSVPVTTRYKDTPLIQRRSDGRTEWGLWVSDPAIRQSVTYVEHQVTDSEVGRLDMIANYYYGDPGYWWVIADANNMIDPIEDMPVGVFLRIPDRNIVDLYIQRQSARPSTGS